MRRVLSALLTAAFLLAAPLDAAAPATLMGQVRIEGRIEKIKLGKKKRFNPYAAVYGDGEKESELEQSLLVYVSGGSLKASKPSEEALLSQKKRNFTKSIVPVLPGQDLAIRNDDTVRHHIRSNAKPWAFNLKPKAPGETVTRRFEAPAKDELGVVPVYCDIHSNMRSHVLVVPNEHFQTLPETGGAFTLSDLPPGTYTLSAWHPTLKPVPVKLTLKAGEKRSVVLVMQGKKE